MVSGLKFEEVHEVDAWHDTVRLFSVMDFSSNELLGYFFLDIFPRYAYSPNSHLPLPRVICLNIESYSFSKLQRREILTDVCFSPAKWVFVI